MCNNANNNRFSLLGRQAMPFALAWLTMFMTYSLRKPVGVLKISLEKDLQMSKAWLGLLDVRQVTSIRRNKSLLEIFSRVEKLFIRLFSANIGLQIVIKLADLGTKQNRMMHS